MAAHNPTARSPTSSRPKARSLRRDLAAGLGLLMTFLWVLALTAGWLTMRHEVDEIYDAALKRTAERIQMLVESDLPAIPPRISQSDRIFVQILSPDGHVLMQSDQLGQDIFSGPIKHGYHEYGDARTYTRAAADGTLIRVADPLSERREAAWETVSAFFIAAGLMLPLNILAIVLMTRSRLRPVTRFAEDVATRDAHDLEPLATPDLPQELLPIEASVNRLMARLDHALQTERSFSANAAHELRTPIAALMAQTQRLIAEAPEGPLRDRAQAMSEEQKRLTRLAEKLLDLARAEGSSGQAPPRDMRDIATLVVRDFDAGTITLAPMLRPALIAMDPDGFAILLRNLIENATRHGTPPITVSLTPGQLTVTNQAPAVLAERLPLITQRFERAGSRAQGSGLGLAIVAALVRHAGAELQLISPLPGQFSGFSATVQFPNPTG